MAFSLRVRALLSAPIYSASDALPVESVAARILRKIVCVSEVYMLKYGYRNLLASDWKEVITMKRRWLAILTAMILTVVMSFGLTGCVVVE